MDHDPQTNSHSSAFMKMLWAICVLVFVTLPGQMALAGVLPIRTYTSADGLGSGLISSLMRDSRGFLWFCTRDGLTRFDGQRFTTYRVGVKEAASGIEHIYETRNGIYWINTTSGLYRFDPNGPLSSVPSNVLNAEYVSASRGLIYETQDNRLWSLADGLFLVREEKGKFEVEEVETGLLDTPQMALGVKDLLESTDGSLWVLTTLGLVRLLPNNNRVIYRMGSPLADPTFSITADNEGRIWFTRLSGIYILKPEPLDQLNERGTLGVRDLEKAIVVPETNPLRLPNKPGDLFKFLNVSGIARQTQKVLYRSADGHIWISTPDSLNEFDGLEFHSFGPGQGFNSGYGQMVEDLNGNLWIGGSKGVARLNRQGLTTYRAEDGLKSPNILAINETKDGKLYVVSNDFFVSELNDDEFYSVRPNSLRNARSLWTSNPVFRDSQDDWWFLTNLKLLRFAPTGLRSLSQARPMIEYDNRNGLRSNEMFHIFEDRRGDLWVSTRGPDATAFALSKWNRSNGSFYTFSEADNFPTEKSVTTFVEDALGQIWLGFYEGGLVRYASGRFTQITNEDDFFNNALITSLHLDRAGKLWIGSSKNGLGRIDDLTSEHPQLVRYQVETGLSSNNVRSLAEDNYGRIYAGTARGVNRITPETGAIRHFSISDGLAGDFVQVAFRDHNGVIWFGTPNGVSKLVPAAGDASNPPSIWFSALRIAGANRAVAKLGTSELSAGQLAPGENNLQIDFFGIDFNPGEPLRYQYMLEGADDDWSAPSQEHTVNYSNLSAGTYRFMVRAVNADGLLSATQATFAFTILPPIWARWWFVTLAVVLSGCGLFSFYRYRLAQLKKINLALDQLQKAKEERLAELERVRSRIARDLHDDIGSSLAQIAIYSEVAKQKQGSGNGADQTLQSLVNTSKDLVESMSDIVWAINPRNDHLHDLTTRMRHFASEILTAANIDLEFVAPESAVDISLGANIRREVFLIFKESVNNIARHSKATRAEIEFLLESGALTLRFKDNGRGFDHLAGEILTFDWQKARGGNGLLSMTKRSQELGGEYRIESTPGIGTIAVLRIPLARDFLTETALATPSQE